MPDKLSIELSSDNAEAAADRALVLREYASRARFSARVHLRMALLWTAFAMGGVATLFYWAARVLFR